MAESILELITSCHGISTVPGEYSKLKIPTVTGNSSELLKNVSDIRKSDHPYINAYIIAVIIPCQLNGIMMLVKILSSEHPSNIIASSNTLGTALNDVKKYFYSFKLFFYFTIVKSNSFNKKRCIRNIA